MTYLLVFLQIVHILQHTNNNSKTEDNKHFHARQTTQTKRANTCKAHISNEALLCLISSSLHTRIEWKESRANGCINIFVYSNITNTPVRKICLPIHPLLLEMHVKNFPTGFKSVISTSISPVILMNYFRQFNRQKHSKY